MQCTFCAGAHTVRPLCVGSPFHPPTPLPYLRLVCTHICTYKYIRVQWHMHMSDASRHRERERGRVCLCVPVLLCVTRIMRTLESPLL